MLRLTGLRKAFGAVPALDGASLEAAPGEVHALVGENGAGKSTLLNLIGGAFAPDGGEMALDGRPYRPRSPGAARAAGVALIHQELALFPHLSVEANITLGMEAATFGLVRGQAGRVRGLLAELGHGGLDPAAPLGSLGGGGQLGAGVQFVLGITAKSGFIFGDAGPFFTELYSLGGVQFGIPLRGYDEFAITPNGFDPEASGNRASPDAFGKSFAAFTVEAGARISQSLYLSAFFDAGNVYRSARQWDPTRLFRGAGLGAAVISPLGPIGVDLGYGFDRVDASGRSNPGWQLHFKLGNFF